MILVDSSAWIEFLRGTGSTVNVAVRRLMADTSDPIVTTEVVHMELLAGAATAREGKYLRQLLARYELLPLEGLADFDHAAAIYRACRRRGHTVRTRLDCLIAAVAIRADAEVLHHDRDFEAIARHTPLRVAS